MADLITLEYALQALAITQLTPAQAAFVPNAISAASGAVQSWCNILFTQATYVEITPVRPDGTIRLQQVPTSQLYRLQCRPQPALSVANGTANSAWVSATTTGDAAAGLTTAGLTLNSELNGVVTSTPVAFTSSETITSLATTIGGVGNGWSASAQGSFGPWPVTELFDLYGSKGASPADQPNGQATYHVFSENITDAQPHPDRGQETGIWLVGRRYGGPGPRWGPDWQQWSDQSAQSNAGRVKATYDGGYAVIPAEVQLATVELIKAQLQRMQMNTMLTSEHAADYSYSIGPRQIMALPYEVLTALTRYRVTNA